MTTIDQPRKFGFDTRQGELVVRKLFDRGDINAGDILVRTSGNNETVLDVNDRGMLVKSFGVREGETVTIITHYVPYLDVFSGICHGYVQGTVKDNIPWGKLRR